jgi:hypothetical protein
MPRRKALENQGVSAFFMPKNKLCFQRCQRAFSTNWRGLNSHISEFGSINAGGALFEAEFFKKGATFSQNKIDNL